MDLDLTNPNQLSPETFFSNEIQLQSAVNAAYTSLQTRGLYMRHMYFMMDNMSQENAGNPQLEADKREYIEYTWPTTHGAIFQYWDVCYRGINKANFAIENAGLMEDGTISESTKQKYIGEAKFLRALYYFFLVSRFGDVPLYTTAVFEPQGRSPKSEVYNLIISDLEAAAGSLLDADQEEFGRATSGAANALLGRVYLFMGNYNAAKVALEKVYGEYALAENFYDNFMDETEDNGESIFDAVFSYNYGGSSWGTDGSGIEEITFRGQEYGLTWFNVYPSDMTLDEFEPGDPRYADSFISNGDLLDPNGEAVPAEIPLGRRAAWKKYSEYYRQVNSSTQSGINFNIIRYADVLLMLAECENEVGTPTQAIAYLNEVRNRPSVMMPNYGTSVMDAAGYPVTNKAEIFSAIVHERQVELCGEQVRFNDLIRWGLDDDVLSDYGYNPQKHNLFPIPQTEVDANEMISQADQNPGY